jgi:hypothetical protein
MENEFSVTVLGELLNAQNKTNDLLASILNSLKPKSVQEQPKQVDDLRTLIKKRCQEIIMSGGSLNAIQNKYQIKKLKEVPDDRLQELWEDING